MSLADQQEELVASVKRYTEDIAPIAKCFLKFLETHSPALEEGLDYHIATPYGPPNFEDFVLVLDGLPDEEVACGVSYTYTMPEVDGCDFLYFTVPFEYFEGPTEWEEYYLNKAEESLQVKDV